MMASDEEAADNITTEVVWSRLSTRS